MMRNLIFFFYLILGSVINDYIYGIHHGLNALVIHYLSYTICRVSKENSFITLRIHLSFWISICQDVTLSSKDMEVLDICISPFPQLILSSLVPNLMVTLLCIWQAVFIALAHK